MKRLSFTSSWAPVLEQFCGSKHAMGLEYETGRHYLRQFDRYLSEPGNQDKSLADLAIIWLIKRDAEGNNTHRVRVSPIREFSKFLISIGHPDVFVLPDKLCQKQQRSTPHFFTSEEIRRFFSACDTLRPRKESPIRHLVLPIYFRLLYCCGLRTCEARLLERTNANLEAGYIDISRSKGPKDRRVYLSDDLVLLLQKYDAIIDEALPRRLYFFPSRKGKCYSRSAISCLFKKIWDLANLGTTIGSKPRAYDFRHNFAIANINKCVAEGQDTNDILPYLMRYMGHSTLKSTLYYVHLVPHFLPTIAERIKNLETLLPEVE